MKKIIITLLLVVPLLSYSQEKSGEAENSSQITLIPTEVAESVLFEMTGATVSNVLFYEIRKNNQLIVKVNFEKGMVPFGKKMDLSFLDPGEYTFRVFDAAVLKKEIPFTKL